MHALSMTHAQDNHDDTYNHTQTHKMTHILSQNATISQLKNDTLKKLKVYCLYHCVSSCVSFCLKNCA